MSYVHFPIKLNRFPYPETRPCQLMNRRNTRQYNFHMNNHLLFVNLNATACAEPAWYVHTMCNKVSYLLHGAALLELLAISQLVKKFPAFYGTRSMFTVFTSLLQRINWSEINIIQDLTLSRQQWATAICPVEVQLLTSNQQMCKGNSLIYWCIPKKG
jgi:hypothetical protein